jgi:C4-dicarboxylate-specific signal transduction histidine kinase
MEIRIMVRQNGSIEYLPGTGQAIPPKDRPGCHTNTVPEINLRDAREDALLASRAELIRAARITMAGQLAASIVHELRQPLTSIVSHGGASLRWLDKNPPEIEEIRAGLREMIQEAERAGHIMRSLEALTTNSTPAMNRIDLHETIRYTLLMAKNKFEKHGISILLFLDAEAACVQGDQVQLQQVLLNLVTNAVDAMSNIITRPRLLSISTSHPDADHIEVCIQDSGDGIAEEAKDKLFDAFYTTKEGGMGMGLAISRSIVDAHHGYLKVTANKTHGSVFHMILPVFDSGREPFSAA